MHTSKDRGSGVLPVQFGEFNLGIRQGDVHEEPVTQYKVGTEIILAGREVGIFLSDGGIRGGKCFGGDDQRIAESLIWGVGVTGRAPFSQAAGVGLFVDERFNHDSWPKNRGKR
jgi:hypothetical protein